MRSCQVFENNPGVHRTSGSPGNAVSADTWYMQMPGVFGSSTPSSYIYSICANYTPEGGLQELTLKGNPYMFTARAYDIETGLYYYRARYYNPYIGRFLQTDPAYQGMNWYAYCGNNPINYNDPMGLYPFPCDLSDIENLTFLILFPSIFNTFYDVCDTSSVGVSDPCAFWSNAIEIFFHLSSICESFSGMFGITLNPDPEIIFDNLHAIHLEALEMEDTSIMISKPIIASSNFLDPYNPATSEAAYYYIWEGKNVECIKPQLATNTIRNCFHALSKAASGGIKWINSTRKGAKILDLATNMTRSELEESLLSTGWKQEVKGAVTNYIKGDLKYSIYKDGSYGRWAVQYFKKGIDVIKIRLEYPIN